MKQATACRALAAAAVVSVLTVSACGDDEGFGTLFGGESGDGRSGDNQLPADVPEDLSQLSAEELTDLTERGLQNLSDEQRAELERMLEETAESDVLEQSNTPDLSRGGEPGNPPQNMCDVISVAEMSGLLGDDVANTLEADHPAEECLFAVDGEAIVSIQAYYGTVGTDPAAYIQEQTADLWNYSDQLYGWGDAARYGSVSDGTHAAIAVAERRADSVVLLFMWMKGSPDEDMLDTGAAIAEAVLPRL